MQLSPKVSMWLHVIIAIMAAIVAGTINLSGLVTDAVSQEIVKWCGFILSIYAVASAAMQGVSSSDEGPFANLKIKFEKIPPKVKALLIIALLPYFAMGITFLSVKSYANPPKIKIHKVIPKPKVKVLGLIKDTPFNPTQFDPVEELHPSEVIKPVNITDIRLTAPIHNLPPLDAKQKTVLADLWTQIQNITLEDLQYANNLAISNNDTIASTCYSAVITLIQKNLSANIDPTTGKPMPLPSVHLVTDAENLIILYRELQPTSNTSIACAPFMNALKLGTLQAVLTGFGTGSLVGSLVLP